MTIQAQIEPRPVQVVFQGGGAKLAALIAAAEAVEGAIDQGKISVVRAAGASAGAIAACMLASRIPVEKFRAKIMKIGEGFVDIIVPNSSDFSKLWSIWRGKPLYEEEHLRRFFVELFRFETMKFERFGDLPIPVFITAADIRNYEKKVYGVNANDRIADALVDSCAIPYVFRTYKKGGPIVDGGLCENLPSDELLADGDRSTPVIGFSYEPHDSTNEPNNIFNYALALLSTAMDNSVRRAATRIAERGKIFHLPTDIGTFDFRVALREIAGGHQYNNIRAYARDKLNEFIEDAKEPADDVSVISSGELPISVGELMERIQRVHVRQHRPANVRITRSALIVTANCLLPTADPRSAAADEIEQVITIQPVNAPLASYRLGLSSTGATPVVGRTRWRVLDASREEVETTAIPVTHAEEAGESDVFTHHVIFFFHEPLRPDGPAPYSIFQTNTQRDTMRMLLEQREDWAWSMSSQSDLIEMDDIVIHVPAELQNTLLSDLPEDKRPIGLGGQPLRWVVGNRMTNKELADYPHIPYGFVSLGWRARAVRQNEAFGVLLRRPGLSRGG